MPSSAVVLETERHDLGHRSRFEVDDRDRVRLLQRDVRRAARRSRRTRARGCARPGLSSPCGVGPNTRTSSGRVRAPPASNAWKSRCAHPSASAPTSCAGLSLTIADRALRVDREVVGRLALVRDDGVLAVGARSSTMSGRAPTVTSPRIAVARRRRSRRRTRACRVGLHRRLERDDPEAVGAHGDRVRRPPRRRSRTPADRPVGSE